MSHRSLHRVTGLTPVIAPCVVVLALTLLVSTGSAALNRTLVLSLIYLLLVVGVYSFVGLSGVFSFGHMTFMAVGAYAGALFTTPVVTKELTMPDLPGFLGSTELSAFPAALAAGAVAAIVALVLAIPLMRLSGLQAGLATVALLVITRVVASNWDQVTGGSAGLAAIPTTTTRTSALIWALAAIVAVWLFQESRTGLRLRASREDEIAARALGIDVFRQRTAAFALSAFLVGVGGALFAGQQGNVTPDQFYISITFLTLAMLVVGGMASLSGAVIGAVAVAVVQELLRRVESGIDLAFVHVPARPGLTEVGLALFLLVTLILRPDGITGGREIRWSYAAWDSSRSSSSRGPDGGASDRRTRLYSHASSSSAGSGCDSANP
jgi:branched-chain amino acid transport system permease protein